MKKNNKTLILLSLFAAACSGAVADTDTDAGVVVVADDKPPVVRYLEDQQPVVDVEPARLSSGRSENLAEDEEQLNEEQLRYQGVEYPEYVGSRVAEDTELGEIKQSLLEHDVYLPDYFGVRVTEENALAPYVSKSISSCSNPYNQSCVIPPNKVFRVCMKTMDNYDITFQYLLDNAGFRLAEQAHAAGMYISVLGVEQDYPSWSQCDLQVVWGVPSGSDGDRPVHSKVWYNDNYFDGGYPSFIPGERTRWVRYRLWVNDQFIWNQMGANSDSFAEQDKLITNLVAYYALPAMGQGTNGYVWPYDACSVDEGWDGIKRDQFCSFSTGTSSRLEAFHFKD